MSFDHNAKVWRDGSNGDEIALPWKRDDEYPVYPVMTNIVSVLHGSKWTPSEPGKSDQLVLVVL